VKEDVEREVIHFKYCGEVNIEKDKEENLNANQVRTS
jgi:hypothetical protein